MVSALRSCPISADQADAVLIKQFQIALRFFLAERVTRGTK